MAGGQTDGEQRLGRVQGLGEDLSGQRQGAKVLKHVCDAA